MPFYPIHKKLGFSKGSILAPLRGTVQEVKVLRENKSVCHVEIINGENRGLRILVAKWPLKHWGKLRGVFEKKEQAQEYLDGPFPKFDHDGHSLTKISKSDS